MTTRQKKWLKPGGLEQIRQWKEDKLTDAQIAKNMGISHATLCNWKKVFPEIDEAIMSGRAVIIQEAENALYKAALGYYEEEVKSVGKEIKGRFITERIEKTRKYYRPDITALIFLLTNMDKENWKRKNDDNAPVEERPLNKIELFALKGKAQ